MRLCVLIYCVDSVPSPPWRHHLFIPDPCRGHPFTFFVHSKCGPAADALHVEEQSQTLWLLSFPLIQLSSFFFFFYSGAMAKQIFEGCFMLSHTALIMKTSHSGAQKAIQRMSCWGLWIFSNTLKTAHRHEKLTLQTFLDRKISFQIKSFISNPVRLARAS